MQEANAKANNHLKKKGKFFASLQGIAVVVMLFFVTVYVLQGVFKKPDPDGVLVQQIEELRKQYDYTWSSEGKPLAEEKKRIYERQQDVEARLTKLRQDIGEAQGKVGDQTRITSWTPVSETYYKETKQIMYKIIPDEPAIGGGNQDVTQVYTKPQDLFYTCLKAYNCRVTQSDKEHFTRNGYLATDVGTNGQNVPVHLPDYLNNEVLYTIHYVSYPKTTGDTVELTGEYQGVKFMWRIGHVHFDWNGTKYNELYEGKQLKTGEVVAYSGGEAELGYKEGGNQGATTGRHVHIEYLVWDGTKYAPAPYRITENINVHKKGATPSLLPTAQAAETTIESNNLVNGMPNALTSSVDAVVEALRTKQPPKRGEYVVGTNNTNSSGNQMFPRVVFATSYNPEARQTDGDPRTGANGVAMREGMIAVSRDMLQQHDPRARGYNNGSPLAYGMKVKLTSPIPQCNGVFEVQDTMNIRYGNRIDLFYETRAQNTSCWGVLEIVQ